MAYITQEQLRLRYPLLNVWADQDLDRVADSDVVQEIIEIAEGEIDAACATAGYVVPLTLSNASTEKMIRNCAGCIAGYRLALNCPGQETEQFREQYQYWVDWLNKLAEGDVTLPDEAEEDDAPAQSSFFVFGAGERTTYRDWKNLTGFGKLSDED